MAPPKPDAALRAYVKLFRASRAVQARVERSLAPVNLTITQLGVLDALLHKGPLAHRDLGRKLLTSAGNLTDVIDKLAARGLVQRLRCADDRRLVRMALTEAGREKIEALFPAHAADIGRAMGGLSETELGQLDGLLGRLGRHAAALNEPDARA